MDLQLGGKIALVSGSTAGIGNAIATSLAREGASVIVNGRSRRAAVPPALVRGGSEAPVPLPDRDPDDRSPDLHRHDRRPRRRLLGRL